MLSLNDTFSNHIMVEEKQFLVDFISTTFNQDYTWEFNLIPITSRTTVEITLSNIKRFSALYQKAGLDDGSERDRVILRRTNEALMALDEVVIPQTVIVEVDEFVMADVSY